MSLFRRKQKPMVAFDDDVSNYSYQDLNAAVSDKIKAAPGGKKLILALEDSITMVREWNLKQQAATASDTGSKMAASRLKEIEEREQARQAKQKAEMDRERQLLSSVAQSRAQEKNKLKKALEGDSSAAQELEVGKAKKFDPMADIQAALDRDEKKKQAAKDAEAARKAADKKAADARRTAEEKRAAEQAEAAAEEEKRLAKLPPAAEGFQLQISTFEFTGLRDPDKNEATTTVAYMRLLLLVPRSSGDGKNVKFGKMDDYDSATTVLAHTFTSDVIQETNKSCTFNDLYTMFLPITVPGTVLRVELWGEDNQKTDDFLGQYEVLIDDLVADQPPTVQGGTLTQGGTPLKRQPITGDVKFVAALGSVTLPRFDQYRGTDLVFQLPDPKFEPWKGAKRSNLNAIEVTLSQLIGQGVMTGDRYGKADVYATIELWDDQHKMGEWRSVKLRQADYTHFEFPDCPKVYVPSFGRGNTKIRVQFWDHDTLSYDDFLGQSDVYLDLPVDPTEDQPQGFIRTQILESRTKKLKRQSNKIRGQMQVTLHTKLIPNLPKLSGKSTLCYTPF